jgi:2-oxoglutarate ferredoxin oxidoreductase subunit beta
MSQCPIYYGRKNKLGDGVDIMKGFRDETTVIGSKKKEAHPDLIERGVFVDKEGAVI